MIEQPEAVTLAAQMNEALTGRVVARFARGTMVHKFLWLNRSDDEYAGLLAGRTVTGAGSFGRSLYLYLDGDLALWWGDAGGRIRYHAPSTALLPKCHLVWAFADGGHLTFALQMWGYVKLVDRTPLSACPPDESGTDPLSPAFTRERFDVMLDAYPEQGSKGIKGFLVATGYAVPDHINGLGNAYVQDILLRAGLDPRRKIATMGAHERERLHGAIRSTLRDAIAKGGRDEERDLFDRPGRYVRLMGPKTVGTPCSACGSAIQKIQYLGGTCYVCPTCQH